MSDDERADNPRGGARVLAVYDEALPRVYGYVLSRSGDVAMAEDLTSETFLAALHAAKIDPAAPVSIPWLVGIARHKLVDYWRAADRSARRQERLLGQYDDHDPWEAELDVLLVREVLRELAPQHRAALTLRYLDGLPVAEVARHLARSRTATETLLMRAKAAFRRSYEALEATTQGGEGP